MIPTRTLALCLGAALGALVGGSAAVTRPVVAAEAAVAPTPAPLPPPLPPSPRPVDLVICLDTSGSMENLIESAKQHIWTIVNDLALARPQPRLRVALLTYGNSAHAEADGWVRVDTDLTEDLDLVSQRLFALSTAGGTELVGRVLQRAHDDLSWSDGTDALRLVVVAGNESADQDAQVRFPDACAALAGRDILVNSLYCGPEGHADATDWRRVATSADGHFASIDTAGPPRVIETPFDPRITELSADLNGTYLPFGGDAAKFAGNQWAQDANAAGMNGAAAASRAMTKCSTNYRCNWDLVDALAADAEFDLSKIAQEDLPEAMREMTLAERRAHIEAMAAERKRIQERVRELTAKRDAHVAAVRAEEAAAGRADFESALLGAIRHQAAAKGFSFVE